MQVIRSYEMKYIYACSFLFTNLDPNFYKYFLSYVFFNIKMTNNVIIPTIKTQALIPRNLALESGRL